MAGPTVELTIGGDASGAVRAMGQVGDAADTMERGLGAKAAGMAVAGAGLAAGLSSAFNDSLEFESAGALLDAQLGAGSPLAAAAGEAAGSLYANAYGESIGEVNDAVRSVAQNIGGMSTATAGELEAVTGQIMSMAQVMEIDVAQATGAVGQMIRNGLAKDATEAMDLLTAGTQQGANRMGDLADVFNEYGESFQVVGLDGATAMGSITQAMEAGAWSADLVADAFREFGILAVETGGTASEAYATMGLDAGQMAADVAAGGDRATAAMDTTLDALRAMPAGTERAQLAVQLFGTKAEELGDSLFAIDPSEATARLGEFGGAAAEADQALGETGAAKLEAMTRGFQDMAMSIAGVEGPLGTVATGVMAFGTDAVGIAGSVGMAAMALRGLGIGTAVATAAQWLWNAALSANPIGLVVLAIGLLVGGLVWAYTESETFRNIVNGAFQGVSDFIGTAVGWIAGAIGWFANLPGMVGGYFAGMAAGAIERGNQLVAWVRGIPGMVLGAIGNLGGLLLRAGGDFIGGLWRGIQNAAGWLRDRVFGFFGNLLPGWVKDVLGIRSPSRLMADEVGVELPAGVGVGMEDGTGDLIAQATAMGDATRDAAVAAIGGDYSLDMTAGGLGAAPGMPGSGGGAGGMAGAAGQVRFVGNTDTALATLIMHLIRTGKIQIGV